MTHSYDLGDAVRTAIVGIITIIWGNATFMVFFPDYESMAGLTIFMAASAIYCWMMAMALRSYPDRYGFLRYFVLLSGMVIATYGASIIVTAGKILLMLTIALGWSLVSFFIVVQEPQFVQPEKKKEPQPMRSYDSIILREEAREWWHRAQTESGINYRLDWMIACLSRGGWIRANIGVEQSEYEALRQKGYEEDARYWLQCLRTKGYSFVRLREMEKSLRDGNLSLDRIGSTEMEILVWRVIGQIQNDPEA